MMLLALILATQDSSRLTMTQAIDRALSQYPSVTAARAVVGRANADVREAAATLRPRLALDASLTQYQEPWLVYPLHGFPSAFPSAGEAPVFDRTLVQGSAFINWTLFDFGQRRSRLRATRAMADAADAGLSAAQSAIVARTAAAYLRALTAREIVAAQDQRLTALTAEADRTRRLLAEGTVPRLLVLRADAALARSRAEWSQAVSQREVAEQALARLTDLPGDSVRRAALAVARLPDTLVTTNREELVARALRANPELLEARRRVDAARLATGAARATRYPELRLLGGIVDRGATGQDFRAEWQAGVSLSYSPYTGGQRGAAIARADADAAIATEQRRLVELNAAEAVDRALASLTEARARLAALEVALTQTLAVADVERTALEVGSGTQTDYLDALADVVRERSALSEARHALLAAAVELARVTGDLTMDWVERMLQ